jgi:hypothetical protein
MEDMEVMETIEVMEAMKDHGVHPWRKKAAIKGGKV